MAYLIQTIDGRKQTILADTNASDGAFLAMFLIGEPITMASTKVVRRGIWPFRRTETVTEERQHVNRIWVTSIRWDTIVQMTPIDDPEEDPAC